MPIVIWTLFWVINFKYLLPLLKNNWDSNSWIYILILLIFSRLAISIWTTLLCKQNKLRTNLWTVLALIFGINQLLLINIRIWIGNKITNQ
jgi:hypothetical protein